MIERDILTSTAPAFVRRTFGLSPVEHVWLETVNPHVLLGTRKLPGCSILETWVRILHWPSRRRGCLDHGLEVGFQKKELI